MSRKEKKQKGAGTAAQQQPATPPNMPDVDIDKLASDIYDLDKKVRENTGSALGRVFGKNKTIATGFIVKNLTDQRKIHIVRAELALISNSARTIRDESVRKPLIKEYEDLNRRVMSITAANADAYMLSESMEGRHDPVLGHRFRNGASLIICINRSYGAAGSYIGFGLADRLGINYYDNDIFNTVLKRMEAEQDGIEDEEALHAVALEEQNSNAGYSTDKEKGGIKAALARFNRYHWLPKRDALFFNQTDLLLDMAKREDFVVMGRCADVIFENNNVPHITIFITAPLEVRTRRIMGIYNVTRKEAQKMITDADHSYESYYKYFSGRELSDPGYYDMSINSSSYGIKGSINFIIDVMRSNKVQFPEGIVLQEGYD